ncbi:MAG: energy-coupling factor ABC transporter ATP-binding protein, partial [Methermicoccaceae archaeon]
LQVPEVCKLFEVLKCFGYNCDELPLSIDEAIEHLTKTIETDNGHIHLHIHEHTHEQVGKLRSRYEHH